KCGIIMSDETTWQVNHEPGKKASSKSYIWIHRSGSCEGPPVILYEYTRTRSGDHAKKFLEGFRGFHVSDYSDKKVIPIFYEFRILSCGLAA
ncbi:IS66 family transposase, partial [Desulfosporosinus sp. SRJS8]|uniref:IS66 family transposase n=1 Tax=Desulfosporosinus shakirovi TaxID=2885154 RepID=UPI001E3885EF